MTYISRWFKIFSRKRPRFSIVVKYENHHGARSCKAVHTSYPSTQPRLMSAADSIHRIKAADTKPGCVAVSASSVCRELFSYWIGIPRIPDLCGKRTYSWYFLSKLRISVIVVGLLSVSLCTWCRPNALDLEVYRVATGLHYMFKK